MGFFNNCSCFYNNSWNHLFPFGYFSFIPKDLNFPLAWFLSSLKVFLYFFLLHCLVMTNCLSFPLRWLVWSWVLGINPIWSLLSFWIYKFLSFTKLGSLLSLCVQIILFCLIVSLLFFWGKYLYIIPSETCPIGPWSFCFTGLFLSLLQLLWFFFICLQDHQHFFIISMLFWY